MPNQTVCPNCGELYDSTLEQCPLCRHAPQVVGTDSAAHRHSQKTGKSQRGEAGTGVAEDAPEDASSKDGSLRPQPISAPQATSPTRVFSVSDTRNSGGTPRPATVTPRVMATPTPARDGRGPLPAPRVHFDRRRIPRAFLTLSCLALSAAILVGSSFLLWKKDLVKIPIYDELAAKGAQKTLPSDTLPVPAESDTSAATLPSRAEGEQVPCTAIHLEQTELVFNESGGQLQLPVTLTPADTTDERSFSSSDLNVVKVSPVGIVTAVGPGEAVITVRCGEQSEECTVKCSFDTTSETTQVSVDVTKLVLEKDDITFFSAGEHSTLTITNLPVGTPVSWESEDETICTVDTAGHVSAVGKGTTNVIATVGNLTTKCIVRCNFRDNSATEASGTEASNT